MIAIAVCDDDLTYIDLVLKGLISRAVKEAGICARVDFFTDGAALLREFRGHRGYDIVILDIDMPGLNGKELAKQLRELDGEFWLAFLTAYSNEALNTIPYSVKAFIPKQYESEKILEPLIKLFADYAEENPRRRIFEITRDGAAGLIRLRDDEIFYIQNKKEHVYLVTEKENIRLTVKSLKQLGERYELDGFFRIHTDLIVNVAKIYEIRREEIVLTNGERLPVSRRRHAELFAAFADLMTLKAGKKL